MFCDELEQSYAIKFFINLDKIASKTNEMIKVLTGKMLLGRSSVFEWHLAREEREHIDDQCSGHPSMTKIDENLMQVLTLLNFGRRPSVRMIHI